MNPNTSADGQPDMQPSQPQPEPPAQALPEQPVISQPIPPTSSEQIAAAPVVNPQKSPQAPMPPVKKTNLLAVIGLICSIFLPLIGLVVSIIALFQIKKTHEAGKGLAVAGVVISSLLMIFTLAVMSLIVFASFIGVNVKTADTKRKADIVMMRQALESYYAANNAYPETLAALTQTNPPFLSAVPSDPINSGAYVYTYDVQVNKSHFVLTGCLEDSSDTGSYTTTPEGLCKTRSIKVISLN